MDLKRLAEFGPRSLERLPTIEDMENNTSLLGLLLMGSCFPEGWISVDIGVDAFDLLLKFFNFRFSHTARIQRIQALAGQVSFLVIYYCSP